LLPIASDAVTTGLFTLGGVLAGGLIAAGTQWWVANMRESRLEQRANKQFAASVRTARRLLGDEIDTLALNFKSL
jgi:hypothetical protein